MFQDGERIGLFLKVNQPMRQKKESKLLDTEPNTKMANGYGGLKFKVKQRRS
jgi:hypothetical protein